MAQLFISSTFLDLKECRQHVGLLVRRMGHEDVAMEYFVAEDRKPLRKCLTALANSDLYIGIVAWRYGYIPPDDNPEVLSITHLEYRAAKSAGKECLIFVLSHEGAWPRSHMDPASSRIDAFREELQRDNCVGLFKSVDELAAIVGPAIHQWEVKALGRPILIKVDAETDFSEYFECMKRRYQRLDLDALTPPEKEEYLQIQLRSVFVEQNVRENAPPINLPKDLLEQLLADNEITEEDLPEGITMEQVDRARDLYLVTPPQRVLDVITSYDNRYAVILGDPGAGKTTLLRYLIISILEPTGNRRVRNALGRHLPLLIELRNFVALRKRNKCDSFVEYLAYLGKAEGWNITEAALLHRLANRPTLILFDGLDEIFDPAERELVSRQIAGLSFAYEKVRIVVTTRVIGYQRRILAEAKFTHFTLQDLTEAQVQRFVDRWYALAMSDRREEAIYRRQRIMRSFAELGSIRQLAGNPMLLTIMAIIGKHQELPRERWKLYDHAASVLIEHWTVNKHLEHEGVGFDFIGEEDKREILRRLALRMQSQRTHRAGNYIMREHLRSEFEDYLTKRFSQPPWHAASVARLMIEQFRERNFILALYGANLFGFVHRAFLEYFCASGIVHQFEKSRELSVEELKALFRQNVLDQNWHEVLRLICGLISEKFAGEIIQMLCTDEAGALMRTAPSQLALALQCLAEVRKLGGVGDVATKLCQWVLTLFEAAGRGSPELDGFLHDEIAPSASFIGPNWPDRQGLAVWLRGVKFRRSSQVYGEAFGTFIGSVGKGIDDVHKVMLEFVAGSDIRAVIAIYALPFGWRTDPTTRLVLAEAASSHVNPFTRMAAVTMIADQFSDDESTMEILARCKHDPSSYVRSLAAEKAVALVEVNDD